MRTPIGIDHMGEELRCLRTRDADQDHGACGFGRGSGLDVRGYLLAFIKWFGFDQGWVDLYGYPAVGLRWKKVKNYRYGYRQTVVWSLLRAKGTDPAAR